MRAGTLSRTILIGLTIALLTPAAGTAWAAAPAATTTAADRPATRSGPALSASSADRADLVPAAIPTGRAAHGLGPEDVSTPVAADDPAGVASPSGLPAPEGPSADEDVKIPSGPIVVLDDAAWATCGCVIQGSGTADDPYVVEDRLIVHQASGLGQQDNAIRIENTRAHVVFRDVDILQTGDVEAGPVVATTTAVRVRNASHVTFEDVEISRTGTAYEQHLWMYNVADVTVRETDMTYLDEPDTGESGGSLWEANSEDVTVENVRLGDAFHFNTDGLMYRDVEGGFVFARGIHDGLVERIDLDWTHLSPTLDDAILLRNSTVGELFAGSYHGYTDERSGGTLHVRDTHLTGGDDRAALVRGTHLTLEDSDADADLVVSFAPRDDGPTRWSDTELRRLDVDGNLSVHAGALTTETNAVTGWYAASGHPGEWTTIGQDVAHGLPVIVVEEPGTHLADETAAYVAVLADATLRDVTVETAGGPLGVWFQQPATVEVNGLEIPGRTRQPVTVEGADVALTGVDLLAGRAGVVGVDGRATLSDVALDSDTWGVLSYGTEADLTDVSVEANEGIQLGDGDVDLRNVHLTTRFAGLDLWGTTSLDADATRIDAGTYGAAVGFLSSQATTLDLSRVAVDATNPAIEASASTTVQAENCRLESSIEAGDAETVPYTVSVRHRTTVQRCDVTTADHSAFRVAAEGEWGDANLTLHGSNVASPDWHVTSHLAWDGDDDTDGAVFDLTGNHWAPGGTPELSGDFDAWTDPVAETPIDAAPNVTVHADADQASFEAVDDHALLDAWWSLTDGTVIDVGTWPLLETTLHWDDLPDGVDQVTAHAEDAAGQETTETVAVP